MNNIGLNDRIVRIVVGLMLVFLTLISVIGVWGWVGLILIVTGLMRFCPAYKILGFKTTPKE
ncbi:YgaP family membrane protein [Polynucleobacter kasalickyi]|uniref:Inner membrane protein YgaP-like transmembrane domain-containing protein n=1 Tax=Polynucleobacter kasalickyi TaxID=1938817 RepID=A0A1W1Y8H9_9BURK|nr:DUF2892 domain-containing protein [Polynucleobacter kasalickyi]SMC32472.1 Protein of unknown function [Polynucleobacter kasalickyi]